MLLRFYTEGSYVVLFEDADLQAYRTDRFDGWIEQPADIGPVLFSNTSPTYTNLSLVDGGGGSSGSNIALWIAIAVGAVVILGGGALLLTRRRGTREERE